MITRDMKPGTRIIDSHGFRATLIAQYEQFAWVRYDEQTNPVTVFTYDMHAETQSAQSRPQYHDTYGYGDR